MRKSDRAGVKESYSLWIKTPSVIYLFIYLITILRYLFLAEEFYKYVERGSRVDLSKVLRWSKMLE